MHDDGTEVANDLIEEEDYAWCADDSDRAPSALPARARYAPKWAIGRTESLVSGAVEICWSIFRAHPQSGKRECVQLCEAEGVAYGTAVHQWCMWRMTQHAD